MRRYNKIHTIFFVIIPLLSIFVESNLAAHGFASTALVKTADGWFTIEQLCKSKVRNVKHQIISYDSHLLNSQKQLLQAVGKSDVHCYVRIGFDNYYDKDILCGATQEFYLDSLQQWTPAFKLKVGDLLLSEGNTLKTIDRIEFIQQPIKVYFLEIQHTHIYLVSPHGILTHNIILPVVLSAGLGVSFGSGAALGGVTGGFLGPITFVGGIVVGGLIGLGIKVFSSNKQVPYYKLSFDSPAAINTYLKNIELQDKSDDAQAPGVPTKKDGYIPPKNWDGKKVKNPNGPGYGWPDQKGNIWVPSGPKGHGGPHWDVEYSDGGYDNVTPGGKIRGKK